MYRDCACCEREENRAKRKLKIFWDSSKGTCARFMYSDEQTYSERANRGLSRESAILAAAEKNGSVTWQAMEQPKQGRPLTQERNRSWSGDSAAILRSNFVGHPLVLSRSPRYCPPCPVLADAVFFKHCQAAAASLLTALSKRPPRLGCSISCHVTEPFFSAATRIALPRDKPQFACSE